MKSTTTVNTELFLDSYNEALKKAKAAELTSDLSASETSDLRTRHDRCRVVETDQDEEHVGLAKSTNKKRPQSAVLRHDSTSNTSGLCATAPPVPKGLELNALSWKNGGLYMYFFHYFIVVLLAI